MTERQPDWQDWFGQKITQHQFERNKREPYFRFKTYDKRFNDKLGGLATVTVDLPKATARRKVGALTMATQQRLWDVLDWMSMQYSAGTDVQCVARVWPFALEWALEYALHHEQYHRSPEADNYVTPHASLRDEEYWIVALRMVCFAILSGFGNDMPRVMAFLDYGNADMGVHDGLIERLAASFVGSRNLYPTDTTRHLPYRRLITVFDADPGARPALMAKYLADWYHLSRSEPYFNQHGDADVSFYGYWSWEAGAATVVLNMDDSGYRDMPFYPRDWVDYARTQT
ncbi:DUF1911 domain-containing protein [Cupriavidus gilardii]|uniref:PoNe immunity protein domain-containing protein n=1 Tax=Cupriavidus gilardii TaxID=82541 RepID=UPI001ABECB56|nr:PoNe immunity protein domain-containing protein [Cupriavidus gilardii]MBO4120780.1 DUF1911 domain-containing protein [Cupriavidus gilardii]